MWNTWYPIHEATHCYQSINPKCWLRVAGAVFMFPPSCAETAPDVYLCVPEDGNSQDEVSDISENHAVKTK